MTSPSIRPEKIEELIARLKAIGCGTWNVYDIAQVVATMKAVRESAAALEAARDLLKPFARVADMEERTDAGSSVIVNVNLCRAARAFLTAQEADNG